ncbi:MAG: hypothetical protein ACFB16_22820 [Phormidesmis sp.]
MARNKKASRALSKAEKRLAGMKSIDPKLNLGGGFSVAAYEAKINRTRKYLEAYNMLLSKIDAAFNLFLDAERSLSEMSEGMLMGVAMKFGKRSSQYEMAGGRRRGEKRRATAKSAVNESPANMAGVNESPETATEAMKSPEAAKA